jgi:hypothetical protein
MASPGQSEPTHGARTAAADHLDEAVRSIHSMVLGSRTAPADLHSTMATIATATHRVARLARTTDEPGRARVEEARQILEQALDVLGRAANA